MSRTRAFLIHLTISATVVGAVCAVIFFVWYPDPYFQIAGTANVVKVLIGVDVVLGPLLTLILFKSGKPGLVIDLSIIACLQIAALVYGSNVIFQERPYFVVFAIDRFIVVPAKDINFDEIPSEDMKNKPWREPIFVYANPPATEEAQSRLFEEVLEGKPDIERRPQYWSSYADKIDKVIARADPFSEFQPKSPADREKIERVRQRHANADQLVYLPIISNTLVYSVLLDPETKQPVEFIDINPWEQSSAGADILHVG
jgi:hypothetical protein